ncbi:MAG TPA: hypothetical protein VFP68_04510 [Burkholderiaceae bacterium]|nr:hypothetical protein [Burkholderiaceae bacterium]
MTEQHARRDRAPSLIAGKVAPSRIRTLRHVAWQRLRQVPCYRCIEIDTSFVGELHGEVGEYRLGERGGDHHRVVTQRFTGLVATPKRASVDHMASVDHGDCHAVGMHLGHGPGDHRVDLRWRSQMCGSVVSGLCTSGEQACQGSGGAREGEG